MAQKKEPPVGDQWLLRPDKLGMVKRMLNSPKDTLHTPAVQLSCAPLPMVSLGWFPRDNLRIAGVTSGGDS